MNSFESLRSRLERRQRLIHGLAAMGWMLVVTLGLTALLGVLGSLRLLPTIAPAHWVSVNLLVGALAFAVGWLRPLNRTEIFFRADRNLHSHEQLVTLYELSGGDGAREFLPLLERRLERLSLDVREALPMAQGDRLRWAGVLALALVCLGTTSFVQLGIFSPSPPSPLPSEGEGSREVRGLLGDSREMADWLQTPPVDWEQRLASLRERLKQAREALALNPNDPRARAALQQLQSEISEEQGRVLPPPEDPSGSQAERAGPEASLREGAEEIARPRGSPSDQASRLDQLMQSLRNIQGQAQNLSPQELHELLDHLRESDLAPLVGQALQSVQSSAELNEKLEELLKNLEERQRLNEALESLQREVQSALSQSEAQTARSDEEASASAPPQAGSQSSQGSLAEGAEAQPGERPEGEESQSSSSAGYGHAPLDPEAVQDLPDLSQMRERARPLSVPGPQDQDLQILFEIISMGLPQSADAPTEITPVQINYEKVETLLDLLEIPVELRESVRRYFLSLAKR